MKWRFGINNEKTEYKQLSSSRERKAFKDHKNRNLEKNFGKKTLALDLVGLEHPDLVKT